jgi:DNA processing protein
MTSAPDASAPVRPEACAACLRRAWLVGDLAGHIEVAVENAAGRRAREVLALPDEELAEALAPGRAKEVLAEAGARDPTQLRAHIEAAHGWACCRHDRLYPSALAEDRQAPATVFGRGDPARLELLAGAEDALTVVGSRRPSIYGRQLAETLCRELAAAGLVVVSGMALGIDSRAHAGALSANGVTVAVLGSGPDVPYPVRLRTLYQRIVERGLVLSELPPGTGARRWTFPARNRIMAALSAMTVVVEARDRSGSQITATMASELGREVGAVPGRVGNATAAGTNSLLRDGAQVIRGAQDVLDSMLGAGFARRRLPSPPAGGGPLNRDLAAVLELVEGGADGPDALAVDGGLDPGEAAASLARLELLGYVRCDSAGRFERTTVAAPDESDRPAA